MTEATRREFVVRAGAAITVLAVSNGPLAGLLSAPADAGVPALAPAAQQTFRAAVESVCSYDDDRSPPSTRDAVTRFAAEYREQSLAFRQSVDSILALLEQGPRTPPPIGTVSKRELDSYRGRSFSRLAVPDRLRFLRSWLGDHDHTSLGDAAAALGIDDYGTLHRAAALAVIQLTGYSYYRGRQTWKALGWDGPWLGRDHEGEDLPFSHGDHSVYRVDFGMRSAFDGFGDAA